jgi:hypothetical protein
LLVLRGRPLRLPLRTCANNADHTTTLPQERAWQKKNVVQVKCSTYLGSNWKGAAFDIISLVAGLIRLQYELP